MPKILEKVQTDEKLVGEPTMKPAGINKLLGALAAVIAYGVRNDYCDANAAKGIKAIDPVRPEDKRYPYTVDDLQRIFGSARFDQEDPTRRNSTEWLPLLALFTGARLEEIGQILLSDVKREADIDFLHITTIEDGKTTKNSHSKRKVSVHPELIRCGFLTYVEAMRAKGEVRLFPELKADRWGKLTSAYSKAWPRYRRGLDITDPKKTFHSFRHAFTDAADNCMSKSHSVVLMGHATSDVHSQYGSGYLLKTLHIELCQVGHTGLNLSRLQGR